MPVRVGINGFGRIGRQSLKALIEREQISGVLPEAIQLRKDDAVLADRLDVLHTQDDVRAAADFLAVRVISDFQSKYRHQRILLMIL